MLKEKKKFSITSDEEVFAFAGIYSIWNEPGTNQSLLTYTIITTAANELMAEIHNTKRRMPIVLNNQHQNEWLGGKNYNDFAFPFQANLIAKIIS